MKTISVNTKKIQREIIRLGIKNAEFAKRCDISRQLLFSILQTGRTSFSTLAKIAHGMGGIDPKDILHSGGR